MFYELFLIMVFGFIIYHFYINVRNYLNVGSPFIEGMTNQKKLSHFFSNKIINRRGKPMDSSAGSLTEIKTIPMDVGSSIKLEYEFKIRDQGWGNPTYGQLYLINKTTGKTKSIKSGKGRNTQTHKGNMDISEDISPGDKVQLKFRTSRWTSGHTLYWFYWKNLHLTYTPKVQLRQIQETAPVTQVTAQSSRSKEVKKLSMDVLNPYLMKASFLTRIVWKELGNPPLNPGVSLSQITDMVKRKNPQEYVPLTNEEIKLAMEYDTLKNGLLSFSELNNIFADEIARKELNLPMPRSNKKIKQNYSKTASQMQQPRMQRRNIQQNKESPQEILNYDSSDIQSFERIVPENQLHPKTNELINENIVKQVLKNKKIILGNRDLNVFNYNSNIEIGQRFMTEISIVRNITIPDIQNTDYEVIGRNVINVTKSKENTQKYKNRQLLLIKNLKSVFSKNKLKGQRVNSCDYPGVTTSKRTTGMFGDKCNSLIKRKNALCKKINKDCSPNMNKGLTGTSSKFIDSYKPVNDDDVPQPYDSVWG